MLIECKVRRERTITLGGSAYVFKLDDEDRFVSEVTKQAHIDRFLEIPEYRAVPELDAEPVVIPGQSETVTEPGQLLEPVNEDNEESTSDEGEDNDEGEGDDDSGLDFQAMTDEALAAFYEEEFGSKPHHKKKRETIIKELQGAGDE